MKFTIPGGNVKTTGKVIHCLAKIGEEVYMEPSKDGLTIRTVNLSRLAHCLLIQLVHCQASRSAFAEFKLGSTFFSSIDQDSEADTEDSDRTDENCKVNI